MSNSDRDRLEASATSADSENSVKRVELRHGLDTLTGLGETLSRKVASHPIPDTTAVRNATAARNAWQQIRDRLRNEELRHSAAGLADEPAPSVPFRNATLSDKPLSARTSVFPITPAASNNRPDSADEASLAEAGYMLGGLRNEPLSLSASFECEIGNVLDQRSNADTGNLFNHMVILRSSNSLKQISETDAHIYKAMTCREYLTTYLSPDSEAILLKVYDAVKSGSSRLRTSIDEYAISYQPVHRKLLLYVSDGLKFPDYVRLLEVLNFLCRAIRNHTDSQGATLSTSWAQTTVGQVEGPLRKLMSRSFRSYRLGRDHLDLPNLNAKDSSCWQQLFRDCTILQAAEPPPDFIDESKGKGLELSFGLMLALAATTNVLPIDEGVAFFGYRTLLLPEYICEEHDYVQYHLEVVQAGQIDPIAKAQGKVAAIADPSKLLNMRCFLGWTACADILLGSGRLPLDIKRSGAKPVQQSIRFKEFTVGLQALATTIGQFGLTGEATFGVISHRLLFSPWTDFEDLLFRAAKQVALIVDVKAERSWLVPKLSLLLHLAHVYVSSHKIQTTGLPCIDPHNSPQAVVDALTGKAENIIYGTDKSARRLGPFLIDLNRDLSTSLDENPKAKAAPLKGLELMDIIDRPDRGAYPRKATAGKQWAHLSKLVDVTVVCSEIGSVIQPSRSYRCRNEKCNTLPLGQNYLAAHNSCLGRLTEETKNDVNSLRLAPGVDITGGKSLLVTGQPFCTCQHTTGAFDSCWTRPGLFQSVQKKDRLPKMFRTTSPCMASLTLPEEGAVVFGECSIELPSDEPMITTMSGHPQVA